jgi:isopentenyl phosphate kinase
VAKARLARRARKVNEAMSDLDHRVLVALRKAGVEATALPGVAVAKLRDGRLSSFDVAPFNASFAHRLVPVTYGDAARDVKRGHAIVSGDALAFALAKRLRPRLVVFVTDRDGLYSAPPGVRGSRLAARLSATELGALSATPGDGRHDVTGGMAGKVKEIGRIAALGIPVLIVNGLVAGRLKDALRRKATVGTTISP